MNNHELKEDISSGNSITFFCTCGDWNRIFSPKNGEMVNLDYLRKLNKEAWDLHISEVWTPPKSKYITEVKLLAYQVEKHGVWGVRLNYNEDNADFSFGLLQDIHLPKHLENLLIW